MEKLKKEDKDRFMEKIRKAGDPDNYETSWDESGPKSKLKSKVKKGRQSKAGGTRFELKVRKDLESKGRVVDKWTNNIDLDKGELVIAKKVFNPFKKIAVPGAGFPDFISIKHLTEEIYDIEGVEVKMNGILSKEEKEKCAWSLKNKVFSRIWIAKKGKKRGEIEYIDFEKKYNKT